MPRLEVGTTEEWQFRRWVVFSLRVKRKVDECELQLRACLSISDDEECRAVLRTQRLKFWRTTAKELDPKPPPTSVRREVLGRRAVSVFTPSVRVQRFTASKVHGHAKVLSQPFNLMLSFSPPALRILGFFSPGWRVLALCGLRFQALRGGATLPRNGNARWQMGWLFHFRQRRPTLPVSMLAIAPIVESQARKDQRKDHMSAENKPLSRPCPCAIIPPHLAECLLWRPSNIPLQQATLAWRIRRNRDCTYSVVTREAQGTCRLAGNAWRSGCPPVRWIRGRQRALNGVQSYRP